MKTLAVLATSLVLLLSVGCSAETSGGTKPLVLTSIYPLQFVAERVAGEDADVTNLTSPGAEPHDLELTGKQVAELSDAGLVVYIDGLQPAIDKALSQASPQQAINLMDHVRTLDAPEAEGEHEAEAEHEEGHEEGHEKEAEEAGHGHGSTDPHVWLDPENLVDGANEIASALSKLDPEHANSYKQRARKLTADLTALDNEFMTGLKTCERRTLVTAHAAFGYLARAYDLEQIPIAGLDPSQEPSTSDIARIASEVEHEKVTTIFTERLVSPAVAQTVARETGASTAVLDPLEGLADATSDDDYFSLMRANLAAIRKANGCT